MPISPENRKRYPDDWAEISQRIRFERAGGLCECRGECGVHHGWCAAAIHGQAHHVTGSKVVLTTAHLDHMPEHCEDENLLAMCQRCHLAYDAEHHAQTAYMNRRRGRAEEMFADCQVHPHE